MNIKPVYIYLTNESALDLDVFFDDLTITHTESPIIQEDHYYPYGLTMQGIGKQGSNPFKYNGFEEQDELQLGLYDYQARYYDPALGRFINVDPVADLMRRYSPYNYAFDNPVLFTDPDGMMPDNFTGSATGNWTGAYDKPWWEGEGANSGESNNYSTAENSNREKNGGGLTVGVGKGSAFQNRLEEGAGQSDKTNIGVNTLRDLEIIRNNEVIRPYKPNLFGSIKEIIDDLPPGFKEMSNFAYETVDDLFIAFLQTGKNRRNLEGFGVTNHETTDAGVSTLGVLSPFRAITSPALKGISAARFSQIFKGTFVARLNPQFRGMLNRLLNRINQGINSNSSSYSKAAALGGATIIQQNKDTPPGQ